MKRKMSWFSKIYIVAAALFLLLLLAASAWLWMYLDAYENTRSKYAAADVFEQYFVGADTDELVKMTEVGNGFEDTETLAEALNLQLEDKELEYFSVSVDNNGDEKYAVTADGVRIAYFTVSRSGEEYKYGFVGYELSGVELFLPQNIKKTVVIPEGYTLLLNGIATADKYITTSKIAHYTNDYLPEGEEGLFLTEYTVSGFCFEPTVEVRTPLNMTVETVEDTETGAISADFLYDDTLKNEYSDYCIKIASTYAAVMSEDAAKSEIYKYIDKSSQFYQKVRKSQVSWFWDHDGYKIKDEEASRFYRHSDNMFSCRVKLTQEMYLGRKTEIVNLDLILYMRKVDGTYLLYNAVTNG